MKVCNYFCVFNKKNSVFCLRFHPGAVSKAVFDESVIAGLTHNPLLPPSPLKGEFAQCDCSFHCSKVPFRGFRGSREFLNADDTDDSRMNYEL